MNRESSENDENAEPAIDKIEIITNNICETSILRYLRATFNISVCC